MAANKTVLPPTLKDHARARDIARAKSQVVEKAKKRAFFLQPKISIGDGIPAQWRAVRTGVDMGMVNETKEKEFSTLLPLTEKNYELPQWTPINNKGIKQEVDDENEDEDMSTASSDITEYDDCYQRTADKSKDCTLGSFRQRNRQYVTKEVAVPSRKRKRGDKDDNWRQPSLLIQWFTDEIKSKDNKY